MPYKTDDVKKPPSWFLGEWMEMKYGQGQDIEDDVMGQDIRGPFLGRFGIYLISWWYGRRFKG